jgi:hypothetical protein
VLKSCSPETEKTNILEMLCGEGAKKKDGAAGSGAGCIDFIEKFYKSMNQTL